MLGRLLTSAAALPQVAKVDEAYCYALTGGPLDECAPDQVRTAEVAAWPNTSLRPLRKKIALLIIKHPPIGEATHAP